MSRRVVCALILAAGVTLISCGSEGSSGGVTLEMLDNRFQPAETTVTVGTEVTFVGAGRNPHNAVAADGTWSTEDDFGSLDQFEGDAATLSFDSPGTHPFFCTFHGNAEGEGMVGTLTVVRPEEDT